MELRRTPTVKDSRLFPEPMNDFAKQWRQALDSEYGFLTNPYSAWRAKRSEIKNRLDKESPGYTQEELENTFEAVGLGTSTSPGDFNREEGVWASGSRAMSKAWNSAGMLVDAFEMWNSDRTGDMEDVMTQQQELEDQALENELIDNFQSKTAHGQNVVTQFLFDLASSAPIMLGVMGAGIVTGGAAGLMGAPVWLAGLLGMGVADALSEMGFNYADIVTNPMVRKKMEAALGQEFNDADMDAIREKTQELLMEEADTSIAKVGIANFINPLNWVPVANKFSKLMKIGSGRMRTIGRNALGTGAREGIEEFGQSVGSQYTAGEAQMRAMGKAGVKDIPEMDVSFKQAGYEALMGFTVGAGIGSYQGSRGYSKYFNEKSDVLDVDADGNLIFKKPNQKGFIGAGALRMRTRKHVDAGDPVLLDDWLNGVDERGKNRLDGRERLIILDELERMKENKELLGDKTSPEKREQRQVNAQQFDKYLENPDAWIEKQKTPEMKAEDAKKEQALEKENEKVREAHAKSLEEVLALDPEKDAVEVWEELPSGTRVLHMVHREAEPMVRKILALRPDQKTPLHKEFLRLAHENPDKTQDELVKMMKVEDKADSFLFPKPPKVDESKVTGTNAQIIAELQKILGQQTGAQVDTKAVDSPELISQLQNILAQQAQEKAGRSEVEDAVAAREQAAGVQTGTGVDVTLESTPTISDGILDKNASAVEIENTLKEYHKASGRSYNKDTHTLVLDAIAALKAAQNIPSRTKKLPDITDKKTGERITGRIQKTDWDLSANDRLIIVQNLSQELGVVPSVIQQAQTVETDADVVKDTTDTPTVTEIAPGQTYDNNYDETGTPVKHKFPLQELNTFINREVVRIHPKTPSLRYKDAKTKVSAKHKGGESEIRTSDQLITNPDKGITRLRFMGINKDGVPYFNLAYVREDRSGSTVKGATVDQRDIIDDGAVAHLLSGQQKTFFGVKEVGEGKKKHKVADRTYTTVTALEEIQTSEQADAVLAIQRDLDNWSNEFDKLEKRGDLLSKKQEARKAELIELMTAHKTEQNSLMALGKKTDKVTQKGGRERQEFVPFNALGEIQRDINRRQSNLRKKLKKKQQGENKGRADITTQEEVGITLTRIESVFGGGDLVMDRDYGVKVGKQNKKSITSLKMLKTTPIDTSTLEYALRINGWELVNKDMDGLVENEIEVRVGVNIPVTGVIKYTEDIIGIDGINWTQREKDLNKLLNEKTEEALKTQSYEWWGTKTGLEGWERAYYNRQAKGVVDEVEITDTDTDSSSNWKRSARKWFTTAAGPAKPPKGKNKSGLSPQAAINMVRQQMTEFAPKERIDAITDEEILEFLWKGPGQAYEGVKVPTIAATEKFDPDNPEHKGFEVNVEFKNGKSETVVPRWGKSNKSYQSLAKEVVDSVTADETSSVPEGKPETTKVETKDVTPSSDKLSPAELKAFQDAANKRYDEQQAELEKEGFVIGKPTEDLTPKEEVKRAKELGEEVEEYTVVADNQLALINVKKGGELQKSMPPADARDHGSARFDKLRALPKYRDASLWDASDLPKRTGSKTLTDAIQDDLKEKGGAKNIGKLRDLIRRKLKEYLVLEIQTTQDIEGLRAQIDTKYWDLLVGPGQTAINNALKDRGSTKIDRGNKEAPSTSKKKVKKTEAKITPIDRQGFIIKNVASATSTDIPTKRPKLNHVWRLDPDEANNLFNEEAKKSEKNRVELQEFLTMINAPEARGGDFFVVKKTTRWSDAYILLRDDEGAPTKGREKIPVPQAIVNVLSTQGKLFNSERADFPFDTQRSRKLTREDMENRGDIKYSSELFMQLFRTAPIDLNLLQKAYQEDRIVFAHDPPDAGGGIDNVVEIFWKNEDGEVQTDGVDNIAMTVFKDRASVDAFIADIREKHPETFDYTKKKWLERKNAAAGIHGVGVAEEQHEASKLGTRINVDDINLGLNGAHKDGTVESSELSLEDQKDLDNDLKAILQEEAEYVPTDQEFKPEEAAKDIVGKPEEGGESLESKIARREEDEVRKLKQARDNKEVLEYSIPKDLIHTTPLARERVEEIISKYQKEFPGSAPVTVLSDTEVAELLGTDPKGDIIQGMYWKGRVWIVPSNIISEEEVLTVLWHENVGHLGVELMMDTHHEGGFRALVSEMVRDFPEEIRKVREYDWDLHTEYRKAESKIRQEAEGKGFIFTPTHSGYELTNKQGKRLKPGKESNKELSKAGLDSRAFRMLREKHVENQMVAVKEFIAHHADNLFKDAPPGLFQKISRIIRRILRSISKRLGIGHVRKSEEEIKDILRGVANAFRTGDEARKGTFLATELLHSNLIRVLEKGKNLPKETTIENWRKHLVRLNKSGIITDVEWEFSGIMDTFDTLIEEAGYKYDMEKEDFVYDSGSDSITEDIVNQEIITRSELIFQLKRHIESSYPYRVTSSDQYAGGVQQPEIVNKTQRPEIKRIHDETSRIINDWLLKYHNPNAERGEGDTARLEALEKEQTDEGAGDYDHDEVYKFRLVRDHWRNVEDHPESDWKYSFTVQNQYQREAIAEAVPEETDRGDQDIPDEDYERQWEDAENRISLASGSSSNLGTIVEALMQEIRVAEWKEDNTNPADGTFDVAAFENLMEEMPERRGWQGTHETGYSERWKNLSPTEQVLIDNIDNALGRFWTKTSEAVETKTTKKLSKMAWHETNFPDVDVYEQKSYKIPALVKSFGSESHLRVPGEFVHTRTGIFSNEKGEKIKLLGEVQSDLHQEAKKEKEGYINEQGERIVREDSRVLSLAKASPFEKTWQKKAVFFELKHALSDPTIDYLVLPTGGMVKVYTSGKITGQVHWYEKVLPKALSDLVKPLGIEVEKITIPLDVRRRQDMDDADPVENISRPDIRETHEVLGVDLRKIRAKGDIPSQPLFYSIPRPTEAKSSFNRTNLSEAQRQAWYKMYDRETDANPGGWWRNILQSLKWTLADPYAVIKDEIGVTEYMVSRLAGRADGIITTLLKYAGVTVQQREVDGVIVNETVLNTKMKGLFDTLKPLSTVHERQQFFGYGAYKRADFLMKQGKETFFSPDEIARGLTWNQGRVKNAVTGTVVSREVLYDSIWKEVSAMNNSVVEFGVKMGLLSKKSADNFQKEYYVPFYRLFEEEIGDGKNGNPVDYNSLTGQAGVKRLKGSSKPIGDPFNNLLHNWLHIIDASVKNDAANTTIRSALEIRNPMDSSQMIVEPHYLPTSHSNTVRVKQNGVEKMFNVNHELLYKSLTALSTETKFPGFKHAIYAKGLFTKIVTAMPVFKYNNLIKDTITTAGTTDVGFNLINNAYAGYESLRKDKFKKAEMLVSGAYIQFAYTRGDDPKYAETLLNKELTTGYIVENPETDQVFLSAYKKAKKMGVNLLDKYSKWGDQLENANRAKLFNKLLKEGKSQTEAAFESRDIMDFTLHGGADWVKLVTSLTPFANAMIQGKYKVGRSVINNPKPAAVVAGMVVLASLFESMYFEDDEEWQDRPDWDKDSFWQIKFPGTDVRFNIPKPHEFSIVGNMTWRALDMARGKDPDYGGALVSGIKTLVSREFGIVPIPQIVKPFVEVAMNRNIFFDRDIEPMGSRGLSPSKRYGMYTSETAILASELLEHLPVDKLKLSPYQLEHLIIGYFGWVGLQSLAVADYVTRGVGDFPERPATELSDHYMARRVFKSSPIRNTKSGTVFYERLKELEQTVQDMNLSRKLGHMDDYLEIYEEKGSLLKYKGFLRKRGRMVNDLNARIKRIRFDLKMGAEEKATRIDRLYQLRNDLLRRTVKSSPFQLSALR